MPTGAEIAAGVGRGIDVLARVGQIEKNVLPYATFIAGFFPGAASVLSAVAIAQPWIDKAIAAAPAVKAAVTAGAPIFAAVAGAGPDVLLALKNAYAIFANADPARPETDMTADDVSDREALRAAGPIMFGRQWTAEEEARWFDMAKGDIGAIS